MGPFFSVSRMWESLFGNMEARVLMAGLDAAGKTTILYKIKLNETITTVPTIGFNLETVEYKNVNLTVWDVGGQDKIRSLWRYYYENTDALIFVIDSNDQTRIEEARNVFHKMLAEEELKNAVVLVYCNKQDLPNSMTAAQVTDKLGMYQLRERQWYVQACQATTGQGLFEGLDWVAQALRNAKKR